MKHEHYKLKERIDQLRGMDYSAFLALPSSALGEPSAPSDPTSSTDTGIAELPGAHVNGAAAYNEGERRRKEMLEVALSLEERYKVLLPPDRKWSEKKERDKAAKRDSLSALAAEDVEMEDEEEEEVQEVRPPPPPPPPAKTKSPTKKEAPVVHHPPPPPPPPPEPAPEPEPARRYDSDGESEVDFEERDRLRSKQLKLRIKFPARPNTTPTDSAKPSPSPSKKAMSASPVLRLAPPSPSILESISPAQVKNISANSGVIIRSRDGKFLPKHKRFVTEPESISAPPTLRLTPHAPKRQRTESSVSRASPLTVKHSPPTNRATCVLMVSAMRSSLLPHSRKTQRHVLAFGTRVPPEIEEVRDFEIPKWLHDPVGTFEENGDVLEHGSAYGYSVGQSASVNGVSSVGAAEWEDGEEEDGDVHDAKEEDVDELMEWQSADGGDHAMDESADDIPPIATLDSDE